MNENINELLDEEIAAEIQSISEMKDGSTEKSKAISDLATLYKLRIEENKNLWEADEKYDRRKMEEEIKDRYFKVGIAAAELMIPLVFYGIWMNKGFKFEETGAYTSTTFKGLFNRFRPTKK